MFCQALQFSRVAEGSRQQRRCIGDLVSPLPIGLQGIPKNEDRDEEKGSQEEPFSQSKEEKRKERQDQSVGIPEKHEVDRNPSPGDHQRECAATFLRGRSQLARPSGPVMAGPAFGDLKG